jgi:hypothetical protein
MAMELLCVKICTQEPRSDFAISDSDRLENEHLGNMDQYRVTREVPLPYQFDDTAHEEEEDDDEDSVPHTGWRHRQRTRSNSTNLKPISLPSDQSHNDIVAP